MTFSAAALILLGIIVNKNKGYNTKSLNKPMNPKNLSASITDLYFNSCDCEAANTG